MKKKTKIILAVIISCLLVAVIAVLIKGNLDRQAKKKSLAEGESAIASYVQSFEEESTKEKKAEIYTSFQADEKITTVIKKYFPDKKAKKEDWYKNYRAASKEMYQWFIDYFNDLVQKESDSFENDKSIGNCDAIIGNLNTICEEVTSDTILKTEDKDAIKETISGRIDDINSEIDTIVAGYNDTYESYLIEDMDNASKEDLNTAVTNLTALKEELTNLGTDYFTDIMTNIDSTVESYNNKVAEIEEAEKKAAEEAEKKKQEEKKKKEAAASNNSNGSSNSDSNRSNSSGDPKRGGLTQDSWAITGSIYSESEGCMVAYNAPQVIYDGWNAGKGYSWTQSVKEDGVCYWSVEGGTIGYACDRYGNVLYTFN